MRVTVKQPRRDEWVVSIYCRGAEEKKLADEAVLMIRTKMIPTTPDDYWSELKALEDKVLEAGGNKKVEFHTYSFPWDT